MRGLPFALLALLGCGDDGGAAPSDGRPARDADGDAQVDAQVDAAPPNTTRVGLVQGAFIGGSRQTSVGFYSVGDAVPGCTWSYANGCSLSVCESDAGLAAQSAGNVSVTVDSNLPVVLMPDQEERYDTSNMAAVDPGSSVTFSASGAAVPAFTSTALVMPTPITDATPDDGATIANTSPLTVTWTPAPGSAYINLSQTLNSGPYPQAYRYTMRCDVPSQPGMFVIPLELIAPLVAGTANLTVAAQARETIVAGEYEVVARLLATNATKLITIGP